MGLLNKLKNALFEEEEVETSENDKIVIKDEEIEKKEEVKELPIENDRELFKTENTFKFPDFDEEEFAINYQPPKVKEVKKREVEKTKVYEEPKKPKKESRINKKEKKNTEEANPVKVFVPSPIISPVYGILDKNYKKEDFTPKSRPLNILKKIDVDTIRKKAFGTLEEEIASTISKPVEEFYEKHDDDFNNLLTDSVDDEIIIDGMIDEDINPPIEEKVNNTIEIENELDKELDLESEEEKKEIEDTKEDLDNTLENDLFDLIDSMYDNKEEE